MILHPNCFRMAHTPEVTVNFTEAPMAISLSYDFVANFVTFFTFTGIDYNEISDTTKGNRPNHFHPASAEFCRHQPSHRRCRPHGHGHGHGGHEHEHEHGHGLHGHGDKPPLSVNNLPAGILVNQSTKKERIMNIIQD